jgi:hypothetical protein
MRCVWWQTTQFFSRKIAPAWLRAANCQRQLAAPELPVAIPGTGSELPLKIAPAWLLQQIAKGNLLPTQLPLAIAWHSFELPMREGLQRKAHRICIGKSEDLERKARFFCPSSDKKNAPKT